MARKTTRAIGPHSGIDSLLKLDGRRREARRLKAIIADLTSFAGGSDRISIGQVYLIRRLAVDLLRLEMLDGEMAKGSISASDAKIAHALRNSSRLGLRDLNSAEFRPPQLPAASLAELVHDVQRRKAKAASAAA
jgi:hypothetical protein